MSIQLLPLCFQARGLLHRMRVLLNHDVWFVLVDVCEILELDHDQIYQELDLRDVCPREYSGGIDDLILVNEIGLYRMILSSGMAIKDTFLQWSIYEVLPLLKGLTSRISEPNTATIITHLVNQLTTSEGERLKLLSEIAGLQAKQASSHA